jgi:hypothetical protein
MGYNLGTMAYLPRAVERADRYKVKVDEYIHYRREGYLKVEGLVLAGRCCQTVRVGD